MTFQSWHNLCAIASLGGMAYINGNSVPIYLLSLSSLLLSSMRELPQLYSSCQETTYISTVCIPSFFFFCLILEDCVHVTVDTDMCNVDFVP